MRKPAPAERDVCCDGRCRDGGTCPMEAAFAPGVIDGPYRARPRAFGRRPVLLQALAYPVGVLLALLAWLAGPAP